MDTLSAFAISASGMAVETVRLQVAAINLANVHSTRDADGNLFRPLRVLSGPAAISSRGFNSVLAGVEVRGLGTVDAPERLVFDPGHPSANARGYVSYPGVNMLAETIAVGNAVRAYDANVSAFNATKTMALRALEIGSAR